MKNSLLAWIAGTIWVAALASALYTYLSDSGPKQFGEVAGEIVMSKGEISFRPIELPVWSIAKRNQMLLAGTILQSGSKSKATIKLKNGQMLNLQENSQVILAEPAKDNSLWNLNGDSLLDLQVKIISGDAKIVGTPEQIMTPQLVVRQKNTSQIAINAKPSNPKKTDLGEGDFNFNFSFYTKNDAQSFFKEAKFKSKERKVAEYLNLIPERLDTDNIQEFFLEKPSETINPNILTPQEDEKLNLNEKNKIVESANFENFPKPVFAEKFSQFLFFKNIKEMENRVNFSYNLEFYLNLLDFEKIPEEFENNEYFAVLKILNTEDKQINNVDSQIISVKSNYFKGVKRKFFFKIEKDKIETLLKNLEFKKVFLLKAEIYLKSSNKLEKLKKLSESNIWPIEAKNWDSEAKDKRCITASSFSLVQAPLPQFAYASRSNDLVSLQILSESQLNIWQNLWPETNSSGVPEWHNECLETNEKILFFGSENEILYTLNFANKIPNRDFLESLRKYGKAQSIFRTSTKKPFFIKSSNLVPDVLKQTDNPIEQNLLTKQAELKDWLSGNSEFKIFQLFSERSFHNISAHAANTDSFQRLILNSYSLLMQPETEILYWQGNWLTQTKGISE